MNAKQPRSSQILKFKTKSAKAKSKSVRTSQRAPKLECQIAKDATAILEVQQFRAKVFGAAYQIEFADGIDHDPFDQYSIHVLVRDTQTQKIIACTRVITPEAKQKLGAYYSESEFQLDDYLQDKKDVYEIGRTCVDEAYRGGNALPVLWMGMVPLIVEQLKAKHLIGTVSVNLNAAAAKIVATEGYLQHKAKCQKFSSLAPFDLSAYLGQQEALFGDIWLNPSEAVKEAHKARSPLYNKKQVPSLIKKYRRVGAVFSEQGYFDQAFNCVDYFVAIKV
ncbi:MAG: GNAT family N-acyltransferase, partial [Pseudomonadota bacterium]|nr:GNAT family N-acyltransferase [Pseudomonadota bacterium]